MVEKEVLKQEIKDLMRREIRILNSMVESLLEEQQALLEGAAYRLKLIVNGREEILESMLEVRDLRIQKVNKLSGHLNTKEEKLDDETSLKAVLEYANQSGCEMQALKDKLSQLLQAIQENNQRNNYLIKNKIQLTRDLIQKLHPANTRVTYSKQEAYGRKKSKVSTITIINHEV